jgi:hypothetical protein
MVVIAKKQCAGYGIAKSSPWTKTPELSKIDEIWRCGIGNGVPRVAVAEEKEQAVDGHVLPVV